jgi:DNA topoisomerase-1
MSGSPPSDGYSLVICEKPDAAKRVSEALAERGVSTFSVRGVPVFSLERKGERVIVCSAQGHLYEVSDPLAERSVYPVFDVEWFQHDQVDKKAAMVGRRVAAIRILAKNAERFVNACDYDTEGETIGFNAIRYGCDAMGRPMFRVKFSTLTKEELVEAFENAQSYDGHALARAGRARHVVDFVWGVNLSRMLSLSAAIAGRGYRTVSIGRVQGPTLGFVVDREIEIRAYVPKPYWAVRGLFEKDGQKLVAGYSKDRIYRRADAEGIRRECSGREAMVDRMTRTVSSDFPPAPFNTGDLQKEAYRHFALSPNRTLQTAERLYLSALISYPRTNSQKLPPSINYRRILQGLGRLKEYSVSVGELLRGELRPVQGTQEDSAHPAIYPTGEKPGRAMEVTESRLYDLIVRRFMAVFAPAARRETVTVVLSVNGHLFKLGGRSTSAEGWLRFYGKYAEARDVRIPALKEGERLRLLAIEYDERLEPHPPRFNQSSLLEKMEKESIGTKATRAEIISTLMAREYMSGDNLTASDLGFAVVETMRQHAPSILSAGLTRAVEERLERIENGTEDEKILLRETIQTISDQLVVLSANEEVIGRDLNTAASATDAPQMVLGACPVCKTGKLRVIRSKKTRKRFVGCTNYNEGCRASAPLPQWGTIKTTGKACAQCSWPLIYVRRERFPWKLCVNVSCPSKAGRKHEM